MPRIGPLNSSPVRNHFPGLLPADFRLVYQIYGVAVALGHLSAISTGKHSDFGVQFAGLWEDISARVVESPDDLSGQLDMRSLILAHRDIVGLIHYDVGCLKHRITQEQIIANVFFGNVISLLLVRGHSLEPA